MTSMLDYYSRRAAEYERIYHKPERQADLRAAYARRLGNPEGPFELSARAWYAVGRVS